MRFRIKERIVRWPQTNANARRIHVNNPIVGLSLAAGLLLSLQPLAARAAESAPDSKEVKELVDKAVAYLKKRQGEDGSFAPKIAGPGVSALVAASLLRNGYG